MDIRFSLKRQYRAALLMLRECVEKASDEVWVSGGHPRNFWRIAYHTVFYAHFYMGQDEASFRPYHLDKEGVRLLWEDANPPVVEPYTREEILGYIDHVIALVDPVIDGLDLDSKETGFPWYKDMSKLEHELLSFRHVQQHAGQLSQILMTNQVDGDFWIAKG